jgi:hypothetical protein
MGHVALIRAAPGGLEVRQGLDELALRQEGIAHVECHEDPDKRVACRLGGRVECPIASSKRPSSRQARPRLRVMAGRASVSDARSAAATA